MKTTTVKYAIKLSNGRYMKSFKGFGTLEISNALLWTLPPDFLTNGNDSLKIVRVKTTQEITEV